MSRPPTNRRSTSSFLRGIETPLRHDQRGSVAITSAILAPVLVGGLAVVVDNAWFRHRQAQLQNAADMVALSIAVDLARSTAGVTAMSLRLTARNEAIKFGCGTGCSVDVVYPLGGDTRAVQVVVRDPSATRFFSSLYTRDSQSLSGRASARVSSGMSTSAGGGPTPSTLPPVLPCMVSLRPSGTGLLMNNVERTPWLGVLSNQQMCPGILFSTDPTLAADLRTPNVIEAPLLSAGGVTPATSAAAARTNVRPVPTNPFASIGAPGSVLHWDQFRLPPGTTAGFLPGECMERLDRAGRPVALNWTTSIAGQLQNPSAVGYSTWVTTGPSGRRWHSFSGGGRFCGTLNMNTTFILEFRPGIYYFNNGISQTGLTSIFANNETSTGSLTTVPGAIFGGVNWMPRASGAQVNGVTMAVYGNWMINYVQTAHIRAPTVGPTAGISVFQDTPAATPPTTRLNEGVLFGITGLFYSPRGHINNNTSMIGWNPGLLGGVTGPDGTVNSSCGMVVADRFTGGVLYGLGDQCSDPMLAPENTLRAVLPLGWRSLLISPSSLSGRLF